ncbi:MAG: tetratricopeptide repeat protein, partial [bacterium]|nr:tetratricopeptide repeat protein [bacterium]
MASPLQGWILLLRGKRPDPWSVATLALLLIYMGAIALTVSDYGLTSDEPGHIAYGEAILKWYTSGFKDHAVFESRNTWLYGGLFDFGVTAVSRVLPLAPIEARHFCNAMVGVLGIFAVYQLGAQMGGARAGFLAALFLLLTPRYYGHAFNNPKDIPVAVTYLWGLYFVLKCVKAYPSISTAMIRNTGLAIGAALSVRVGGLLLVLYLGVFLFLCWVRSEGRSRGTFLVLSKLVAAIGAIAYVFTLIFWPYLQIHPLGGFWEAIQTFGKFPETHVTFFEGRYIGSDETPWYYAPKWLLLTLPEHILLGVLLTGGIPLVKRRFNLANLLILTGAFFPIAYAVGTRMPLYDGIRHLLFVMPPLAVIAALGVNYLLGLRQKVAWSTACAVVFCVLVGLGDLIALHPNQYVYFNRLLAGGVRQASLLYDTDYWENSYQAGFAWVKAQPSSGKRRVRAFYEPVKQTLDSEQFEWIHVSEDADYFLAGTRYDRHKLIPGEILHTVDADGVPLLYVIRPDQKETANPFFYHAPYKYAYFGDFYGGMGDTRRATRAYEMAIEMRVDTLVTPNRMWGYYRALGLLYLGQGNMDAAEGVIRKALEADPHRAEAWYLRAQILTERGDLGAA